MDYKGLAFWFSVSQWVFNLIFALCLWFSRRQAATSTKLDSVKNGLQQRIGEAEKKMIQIQSELEHLPVRQDMEQLSRDIINLTKEMAETKGKLDIIGHTALRMNEFLTQEGLRQETSREVR